MAYITDDDAKAIQRAFNKSRKRIVGYKKVYLTRHRTRPVIAVLSIPKGVARVMSNSACGSIQYATAKCRAAKAYVSRLERVGYGWEGQLVRNTVAYSWWQRSDLRYQQGKVVIPDKFTKSLRESCGHGIHFFRTRKEAEKWK